ncbi:hypothetical protein DYU05_12280 [Mucilaginibacter terrenus]|uniref:Zf-HC2 domain-containing protein n=1 Tax=Mucilaginibacter terrenus TaxID=2482727 RepID=A0A3E2NPL1_9SPHI|nr:hypothetical protein [Mucilaginibacter terrenus]RFZ82928.1 hypothetical protein DYU05_12280 [Mucilaginibacter terrenus]
MSNLKNIVYNCRKATYLIDKRMLGKITVRESVELRIHLLQCDVCKLYIKQSAKINEMIKALLRAEPKEITLDDSYKKQLEIQVNDALNKN